MSSRSDNGDIERIAAEAYNEDQAESDAEEKRDRQREHVETVRTNFGSIAFGVVAALIGAGLWFAMRVPGPSEAEIATGNEQMLRLAAQMVRDSMDHEGHPPASMASIMPAAAAVQIRVVNGGVDLVLVGKGGTRKVFIPMEAAGP